MFRIAIFSAYCQVVTSVDSEYEGGHESLSRNHLICWAFGKITWMYYKSIVLKNTNSKAIESKGGGIKFYLLKFELMVNWFENKY